MSHQISTEFNPMQKLKPTLFHYATILRNYAVDFWYHLQIHSNTVCGCVKDK